MLPKIQKIRHLIDESGLRIEIEVDGGITADNSSRVIEEGADILVSGSYIFSSDDIPGAIRSLKRLGPGEC
jgi:ribulose-phosphate 3-epimerase